MREVEVITTIQITDIHRNAPDDFSVDKKEWAKLIANDVKTTIGADNILVTNVQEFVRDKKHTGQ